MSIETYLLETNIRCLNMFLDCQDDEICVDCYCEMKPTEEIRILY